MGQFTDLHITYKKGDGANMRVNIAALFAICLVLTGLKVLGIVTWPWIWVWSPIWVPILIVTSFLFLLAITTVIVEGVLFLLDLATARR